MKAKTKGSNAERELLRLLWERGFGVSRVAGSGSVPLPSADLIVGAPGKSYIIECKATRDSAKYFPKEEIRQLNEYSSRFGGTALLAIKFFRTEWLFVEPSALDETGRFFVARKEKLEKEGKKIDAL